MVKPVPSLATRASGALLGHAAGNALGLTAREFASHAAIAARFAGGLTTVIRQDTAASPCAADVAFSIVLAEELLRQPVDLKRLADRWIAWADADGRGLGSRTRQALDHLRDYSAPLASGDDGAGSGAVAHCLPVALATLHSPRNLVSATYHIAALTHPEPHSAWSAVALNVAAARFLHGARDFVPDVIEMLRANDAPAELLAVVRRVPLVGRQALPVDLPPTGSAVQCLEVAFWLAYHEPVLERALVWLVNAGGDTATNAAVAGGLLGARDGEEAVPAGWLSALPDADALRTLADRLVGSGAATTR